MDRIQSSQEQEIARNRRSLRAIALLGGAMLALVLMALMGYVYLN
jgi:hypothetical protein